MAKETVMLTTIDNPFDPKDQFDEWLTFDIQHGYNTCQYLDRMADTSKALTYEDEEAIIVAAIDAIVEDNPVYVKKVYEE